METIKQNLGIDVGSKDFKVSLRFMMADLSIKTKGSRTFKNTSKGFESLQGWVEKKRVQNLPLSITMEATGVYYENLAYYFHEKKSYLVHVVLPNSSNAFFKSLKLKSKTDKIDAWGLAQMGLERRLNTWVPISEQMRDLKKIVRERLRLIREKNMVTNQLHAELASFRPSSIVRKRSEKRIAFLDKQIQAAEKDLRRLVDKDPDLKERLDNVCTAHGIGFITAIGIVAEYNGFILFKNRNQVVSFAGYDVKQNESGSSINGKKRISKQGNSYVRQMLYMSAMSAAVHDPHHRAYYLRIVEKTGIKMKGNVAIQRKLLLLIYTLFTKNEPYDSLHFLKVQNRLKSKSKSRNQKELITT